MRMDGDVAGIKVCPPEYDTGADRGRFQDKPGFFAAMNADAGTNRRTFNCLLHLHATQPYRFNTSGCNLEGLGRKYKTRLVSSCYKKGRDLHHGPVFIVLILKQIGREGLCFLA
tara:strand:+ start:155130 stop:155471 length:342 start_codon:yes stop_codon:yes gene_type:complete